MLEQSQRLYAAIEDMRERSSLRPSETSGHYEKQRLKAEIVWNQSERHSVQR
jgi:hypothetical protein